MAVSPVRTLDRSQDACGQKKERGDKVEGSTNDDPDKPEGQKYKPDKRIEKECGNRKWPARDEKYAEEEQLKHR